MKICHVITRLIIGGAQENTVLTCRGLTDLGHEVTLIAGPETGPEGSLWDKARDAGCRLVRVEEMRRSVRPLGDWRAARNLRRLFAQLQPDVVHTHSSKAGILGRRAAAAAGVPVVVHTIHGMSFNRTQAAPTRWLYRTLERRAARGTTAFVTVADAMIDQAVAAGLAPRERFTTIRSGMETDRLMPQPDLRKRYRATWRVAEDEIIVGTVARLFDNKGYEEIMAAMPAALAGCERLKFVWVGDGANRSRYEQRLEDMGLRDKVHLVGLVPPDEVGSIINGFDLLVHASRWEGLPRVLPQSLLTEVPAVSFDNDGAPEVITDGETGLLVRFGDVHGLSGAIVKLATDKELRRRLGQCGRARCLEDFDWRRMVARLDELYQRLTGGG